MTIETIAVGPAAATGAPVLNAPPPAIETAQPMQPASPQLFEAINAEVHAARQPLTAQPAEWARDLAVTVGTLDAQTTAWRGAFIERLQTPLDLPLTTPAPDMAALTKLPPQEQIAAQTQMLADYQQGVEANSQRMLQTLHEQTGFLTAGQLIMTQASLVSDLSKAATSAVKQIITTG